MDVLLTAEYAFPFATNTRISQKAGHPLSFFFLFLRLGSRLAEHTGEKCRRGSGRRAPHRRYRIVVACAPRVGDATSTFVVTSTCMQQREGLLSRNLQPGAA